MNYFDLVRHYEGRKYYVLIRGADGIFESVKISYLGTFTAKEFNDMAEKNSNESSRVNYADGGKIAFTDEWASESLKLGVLSKIYDCIYQHIRIFEDVSKYNKKRKRECFIFTHYNSNLCVVEPYTPR